jgi:hypothetical protein
MTASSELLISTIQYNKVYLKSERIKQLLHKL